MIILTTANSGANRPSSQRSSAVRWLRRFFYENLASPRKIYREKVEQYAPASSSILDVGCGYAAPDLHSLGKTTATKVGMDVVDGFQESAAPDVKFVKGDCHKMPFPDGSFDLVICRSVLEHLEDPSTAFREIHRVLRPSGHFVFLTPNRWDYVSLASSVIPNRLHPRLVRLLTGRAERDTFPTFYRANTASDLKKIALNTAFTVEHLLLVREHPHYMQFNAMGYMVGVSIEQCLQRPIASCRPWILGVLQRGPS